MNVLKLLPKSLSKRLVQNILRHADPAFDISIGRNSSMGALLRLKHMGFEPATILDIGAYEGQWTKAAALIFPKAVFHLFEPQLVQQDIIRRHTKGLKASLHPLLLGPTKRANVPFHVMASGSSVLPEQSGRESSLLQLPMSRLQDVLTKPMGPILMKLDVQGFELEVLKGAGPLLDITDALLLECSTVPYNAGAPLLPELMIALQALGFLPFDIGECHRRNTDDVLLQVDLLFVRKASQWYAAAADLSAPFTVYTS